MVKPKQINEMEILNTDDRIFKSWGSVEIRDKEGDLIPMAEFKPIMRIIMKRGGNIMDRHSNRNVGKILNYEFKNKMTPEGEKEGLMIEGQVHKDYDTDDMVWEGVKSGVFKGLSFGGRNKSKELKVEKGGLTKVLKQLEGFEFSLVPGMGNQEATMEEVNYLAKSGDIEKSDIEKRLEIIENKLEIKKESESIKKDKVFLSPGEKPPKGVKIQTGPKGGQFYFTEGNVSDNESNDMNIFENSLKERGLDKEQIKDVISLAEELKDNNAKINNDGTVKLFHRTSNENKESILSSGKMKGLEDGIFFTTNGKESQAEGFGDSQIELNIPLEKLQLDDVFGNEAHVRIPTKNINEEVDVKEFLVRDENTKKEENPEDKKESIDDKEVKKSLTNNSLVLPDSSNNTQNYIKNSDLNINMVKEVKKEDEVIETPTTEVPTNPMDEIKSILSQILQAVSTDKAEVVPMVEKAEDDKDKDKKEDDKEVEKAEDDDKDKDKKEDKDDEVEKEEPKADSAPADGSKVTLPKVPTEKIQDAPIASGAEEDEVKFIEKDEIAKIKVEMKEEIMKELVDKMATTPRPISGIIKKEIKVPKNFAEANKMFKEMGK